MRVNRNMTVRQFIFVALAATALLAPSLVSAQLAYVTAVPAGTTKCAVDSGTCTLPQGWSNGSVYYGANAKFAVISAGPGTKPFVCLPQTFGIPDPVPNVQKTCYYLAVAAATAPVKAPEAQVAAQGAYVTAVPAGTTKCAVDFGTCTLPQGWSNGSVYYGANAKFAVVSAGPGMKPFVCLPQTFGIPDPVPNVQKTCYYLAAAAATAPAKAPEAPKVEKPQAVVAVSLCETEDYKQWLKDRKPQYETLMYEQQAGFCKKYSAYLSAKKSDPGNAAEWLQRTDGYYAKAKNFCAERDVIHVQAYENSKKQLKHNFDSCISKCNENLIGQRPKDQQAKFENAAYLCRAGCDDPSRKPVVSASDWVKTTYKADYPCIAVYQ